MDSVCFSDQNTSTEQVLRYSWDAIQARYTTNNEENKLSSESESEMIHQRRWFALIDSQFSSSSNTHSPRMYFSLFSLFIDRKVSQITLILIGSLFFIISRLCFSMQTLDFKVHKLVHSAVRVHTGITVHMYVCQTKFNWSSTHTYS